jgi:nucleoside-diphosphate-sugar epimerase
MRILLTGGAGFIGSNVAKRLMDEVDVEFDIVDDLSNGHLSFVHPSLLNSNMMIGSFDSATILEKIRSGAYDVVIHLAAVPRVSYSVEFPLESHTANVTSTMKLIEACRGNIKRFVFASSSSVYGGADQLPTPPSHAKNPKSPYALQKSIIEDYLKMYYDLYGFDSVSLRFFNVFGPNQLGDSPYSTAVSAWVNSIMKGDSMRSDGDGSQSRDMCYVDNVVDACIRAAKASSSLKAETLNIACGDRTSNKEILEFLLKKFPEAKYHNAPWRPGDVMHTQADVSRTEEVLGYKPLVYFWEGLDRTIQWYQDNWELIQTLGDKENI